MGILSHSQSKWKEFPRVAITPPVAGQKCLQTMGQTDGCMETVQNYPCGVQEEETGTGGGELKGGQRLE